MPFMIFKYLINLPPIFFLILYRFLFFALMVMCHVIGSLKVSDPVSYLSIYLIGDAGCNIRTNEVKSAERGGGQFSGFEREFAQLVTPSVRYVRGLQVMLIDVDNVNQV